MIFRAITGDNDWTFGKGTGSYLTGNNAIMANVRTSIYFFLNDCFFALGTGIDWWNLIGAKNPSAKNNILLQTRETISKCEGIIRINKVDAVVNPATRKLTISYNVDTTYTRNLTSQVQIF